MELRPPCTNPWDDIDQVIMRFDCLEQYFISGVIALAAFLTYKQMYYQYGDNITFSIGTPILIWQQIYIETEKQAPGGKIWLVWGKYVPMCCDCHGWRGPFLLFRATTCPEVCHPNHLLWEMISETDPLSAVKQQMWLDSLLCFMISGLNNFMKKTVLPDRHLGHWIYVALPHMEVALAIYQIQIRRIIKLYTFWAI